MEIILGIIIGVSVCLVALLIYKGVKKGEVVIDYNKVKYGSIERLVKYKTYVNYSFGEKISRKLILKVRFIQDLGGGNIQVNYEDIFNIVYRDKAECLRFLNSEHSCIKTKDVNWVSGEYGPDITFTKGDFFNLLRGKTLVNRGERYKLSETITPSDLLNYITNV